MREEVNLQGEPVVKIGVDIGSVTIGVAVLKDDQLVSKSYRFHYGEIRNTFTEILKSLDFPRARLALTGRGAKIFQRALRINNVVAAVEGVKWAAKRIPRYVLGRFGYEAIVSEETPESIVLKFRKMASPVLGTAHPLMDGRLLKNVRNLGIPPELEGETAQNVMKIFYYLRHINPDGFVHINPLYCCPGVVSAALLHWVEGRYGVPVVHLFYDGIQSPNENLEPYIYYLKKRKERRLSQAKRRD